MIIVKHNLVTDSSYSSLAFLKDGTWYPPRHPLLKGTKRKKLLLKGLIKETDIHIGDIKEFEKVSLINAMNDIGECLVEINRIQ